MTNLFDYLLWRGDLTLNQAPFNDVDNLILCALSYVKLCGIVPPPGESAPITVAQAARRFFAAEKIALPGPDTKVFCENNFRLLDALSKSPRFSSLLLSDCVDVLDAATQKQFSAITISLGGHGAFVAFRGTDSTLVGWKEDFNMSFLPQVPSQRSAVEYLEAQAKRFTSLRVGGHSKGGNLAVYSAVFCSEAAQKRLMAVYNNDGPGFNRDVMALPEYLRLRSRVRTFLPQSSVVGMLMEHEESYAVVHSSGMGILQHDPYSWEVLGSAFSLLDTVTDGSRFVSDTLKTWMSSMDEEQREKMIDVVFDVLGATNAKTTAELGADWLGSAGTVLTELKDMDGENRKMLFEMFRLLMGSARQAIPAILPKRKELA